MKITRKELSISEVVYRIEPDQYLYLLFKTNISTFPVFNIFLNTIPLSLELIAL